MTEAPTMPGKPALAAYDHLTYLDNYGGQILMVIAITIVTALICAWAYTQTHIAAIQADWPNQRCNPTIMPFAGYIYNPDPDKQTAAEATKQNFEYCNQNTLKEISADALQPITFALSNLNAVAGETADTINNSRSMFDKIRTNLQDTTGGIMGRALNVTIPIQQMVISFKDMMGKVQGVMTAALFTSLGSYYTLKSLLGSIAELLTKCLIALAAMIIVMWLSPFTWGAAASMTAIFVSVSIPLGLMLSFMTDTLHVKTGLSVPHVPKRPACFAGDVAVLMQGGDTKPIKDIMVGDILWGGSRVTARLVLSGAGCDFCNVGGVIVTDDHLVYDSMQQRWVKVAQYLGVKHMTGMYMPHVYCLNTTSKRIWCIGNATNAPCEFSDWDELVSPRQCDRFLRQLRESYDGIAPSEVRSLGEITADLLDRGYPRELNKAVLKIGAVVRDGGDSETIVYGVVETLKGWNVLTHSGWWIASGEDGHSHIVGDYNHCIDDVMYS